MSRASAELEGIRRATRVALPASDAYVYRLGVAVCGFATAAGFMAEVTGHLRGDVNRDSGGSLPAGKILEAFRAAAARWTGAPVDPHASTAAKSFGKLVEERNDFIHAFPITGSGGEQILHRRKESSSKYLEVTDAFLDDFISRLEAVVDQLYAVRAAVGPDL